MAVSNTSGKIYDVAEYGKLEDTLNELSLEMEKIDSEKSVQNKKILRYGLLLTGVVVSLYVFSVLVNKKK
jgi:tetrahydromethanopterin S-methyltransferase subunit G